MRGALKKAEHNQTTKQWLTANSPFSHRSCSLSGWRLFVDLIWRQLTLYSCGKGDLIQSLPVGRVGEAHDVAQAYLFLMQEGFSTGQTVVVDGGTVLV